MRVPQCAGKMYGPGRKNPSELGIMEFAILLIVSSEPD